jgi:hypothetical protein
VFKPLTDTKTIPADVKTIKNAAGALVPYIVRVETTTIDRGIAQITMLFDPTKDVEPTPTTPPKNWNKRLVYGHGTGCVGGWYIQGGVFGYNPMNDTWLSRGYAVANNTLNHPTNACNNVLSGEAASMTKEYFIKRFGAPVYTIPQALRGARSRACSWVTCSQDYSMGHSSTQPSRMSSRLPSRVPMRTF